MRILPPLRQPEPLPDYMSVRDIARRLGLSPDTVRKLGVAGHFGPPIRLVPKGKLLFGRDAVEARLKKEHFRQEAPVNA